MTTNENAPTVRVTWTVEATATYAANVPADAYAAMTDLDGYVDTELLADFEDDSTEQSYNVTERYIPEAEEADQ